MKKVTGFGGIFFKSNAPKDLMAWYDKHLGLQSDDWGGKAWEWREKDDAGTVGQTVFNPFKPDSKKFAPSELPYMFNFRVHDLDALMAQLKSEGVQVVDDVQDTEYGKFGWIMDPDGRKIELWQAPAADPAAGK